MARRVRQVALLVLGALAACRSPAPDGRIRPPVANVRAADTTALPAWRGVIQQPATPRPAFVLRTTDGRPYDFRRETTARPTLLFFGYTSCPDVCPVHLANIAAVLKKLPPEQARAFTVVFVTTDPKRDTPARIRSWLDQFDPRFVGLVGTPREVEAAQRAAGLDPAAGDTTKAEYDVAHAAVVLGFTRDDSAHVVYPFGVRQDDWAVDLPRLLSAWPAPLEVQAPFLVAPAPDVAAFYADLIQRGPVADTLVRVETPAARAAAVHGSVVQGTMARMVPTGPLPIRDTVRLERGGGHVMLEGLRRPLAAGDTVEVTLVFSRAGARVIRAPVRPVVE